MGEMPAEKREGAALGIALLHYPVYDKNRRIVATAVTNLDLHDIARLAKTYDLSRYYVVTPLPEQREICQRIINHWLTGWGATYNPKRREALELITVVATLDEAIKDMSQRCARPIKTIATGAKSATNCITYQEMSEQIRESAVDHLLLLGTGWGLAEQVTSTADYVLAPISGRSDYNHLSVRSAASIIVDRLMGDSR